MGEYVTLMGSEDVQKAGYAMAGAASDMIRAAREIDGALFRHRQFLDDWLSKFETIIDRYKKD